MTAAHGYGSVRARSHQLFICLGNWNRQENKGRTLKNTPRRLPQDLRLILPAILFQPDGRQIGNRVLCAGLNSPLVKIRDFVRIGRPLRDRHSGTPGILTC